MRLKLQNIGIIESADININGITLIAGQNDSGKSTVGKVLYALIRGMNIDEDRFNSSKNEFVRNKIRDIRNLILRNKFSELNDNQIQEKFISNFLNDDKSFFGRSIFRLNFDNPESILNLQQELSSLLNLFSNYTNLSLRNQLSNFITEIIDRLTISIDSDSVLHYELDSFFENEFGNQIQNKFNKKESNLEIIDSDLKKIIFKDSLIFEGFNQNSSLYFNDVFFIETPIKLGERFSLFSDKTLRDKNAYLNSKVFQPKKEKDIFTDNDSNFEKFTQIITEIIKGEFIFNSKNELVFKKRDIEFDLNNVATGIKSFGVLQLLLQNNLINSNSLLIIDEPEVHLHPTWQVKFAEILVRLSQEFAIPIVLTSHSPYFIESLEAYTKKYKYEDSTNFYFAEKSENGLTSKIIDVTKNILPILKSISEAFYIIQDINDEN